MADDWIMVRVRRETHRMLCQVRDSMLKAMDAGQVQLDLDHTGHVSLDQVIRRLIDARRSHDFRRRKSAAAKKRKGGPSNA